jgi:hypothetical protein
MRPAGFDMIDVELCAVDCAAPAEAAAPITTRFRKTDAAPGQKIFEEAQQH